MGLTASEVAVLYVKHGTFLIETPYISTGKLRAKSKGLLSEVGVLFLHILYLVSQELFECGLVWQLEHIGGNKEIVVQTCDGVFHHLFALPGAEQDANRRIVAFVHLILLIVRDVGVELAQILVTELVVLQFHNDATVKDTIVKHQVSKVVFIIDNHALLPILEAEALAQF